MRATTRFALASASLAAAAGVLIVAPQAASAHHADLSATAVCDTSSGKWGVSVTLGYPNEDWSGGAGVFTGSAEVVGIGTVISPENISPGGSASGNLGTWDHNQVTVSATGKWANRQTWSGSVTVSKPADCKPPETSTTQPPLVLADTPSIDYTPPTCDAAGSVVLGQSSTYSWTGPNGEGKYKATANTGYYFADGTQRTFGPYAVEQLSGDECAPPVVEVTPVAPEVVAPTCDAPGSITPAVTEGVSYAIVDNGDGTSSVTANFLPGYTWSDPTLARTVTFGPYDIAQLEGEPCVTPTVPTTPEPTTPTTPEPTTPTTPEPTTPTPTTPTPTTPTPTPTPTDPTTTSTTPAIVVPPSSTPTDSTPTPAPAAPPATPSGELPATGTSAVEIAGWGAFATIVGGFAMLLSKLKGVSV